MSGGEDKPVFCNWEPIESFMTPPTTEKRAGMYDLMAVTKALADENRVRLLAALEGGELCVCQLIELIGLAPSTVSKHLSILRGARLIEGRKNGRWMYYRLTDEEAPTAAKTALAWLLAALKDRPRILEDRRRLEQVMKTVPEELCRPQGELAKKSQKSSGNKGSKPDAQ
jgi:DNA-binding transcriptional ArsR family regulator